MSYIQLMVFLPEPWNCKVSSRQLQAENVTLTAQYEQMFDLATVKEVAEAAGMSKPSSSQIYLHRSVGGRQCRGLSAGGVQSAQPPADLAEPRESMPWWNISSDGRTIMKRTVGSKKGAFLLLVWYCVWTREVIGPQPERRTGMTDNPEERATPPAGRTR